MPFRIKRCAERSHGPEFVKFWAEIARPRGKPVPESMTPRGESLAGEPIAEFELLFIDFQGLDPGLKGR